MAGDKSNFCKIFFNSPSVVCSGTIPKKQGNLHLLLSFMNRLISESRNSKDKGIGGVNVAVGTTVSVGVAVSVKGGAALGEDVIVNSAIGDGSRGTEVWAA